MAIRVTQSMLNFGMMRNLSKSMGNMDTLQRQLSSGRLVNRPSDNPVIASRGMFYRTSLNENEQFQRNVTEAYAWLETSDKALDEAGSMLQRVRELLVYSGDAALAEDSLKAMGEEIDQIREHLGNVSNQMIGGRYIFAGKDTKNPPFDTNTGEFRVTNSEDIMLEINQQVLLPINVKGGEIFNYPDSDNNIFKLLEGIANDLKQGIPANDRLNKMDEQTDNLLAHRSALGARVNRMELIKERLANEEVSVTWQMSENEDVDIAKVITNLKMQENVHRAALGAGARIIQPSLMDFLR